MIIEKQAIPLAYHSSTFQPNILQKLDRITYQQLFIRKLMTTVKWLRYALLHPRVNSISAIAAFDHLLIAIDQNELDEWKSYCKFSPYVSHLSIIEKAHLVEISIRFEDHSHLVLSLIHSVRKKDMVLTDIESIISEVHTTPDGLKCASATLMFEYLFLENCLKGSKSDSEEMCQAYFQALPSNEQKRVSSYMLNKYPVSVPSMQILCRPPKKLKLEIQRFLMQQPINRGLNRLWHLLQYLNDQLHEILNTNRKSFLKQGC